MVKFVLSGQEGTVVGIGISDENVERLTQGIPIKVILKDLGIPGDPPISQVRLFLFHGKTEQELDSIMREFMLIKQGAGNPA